MEQEQTILDRKQIQEIIPHREPFIFVDRIVELEYGKRAVGILDDLRKAQHAWMKGHFPGFPAVPGAILMEALAEVGAVAALGLPENRGKIAVLTGADRWRFRKIVLPGNPIHLEAVLSQFRRNIGIGQARAYAPGEARAYAEGQLSFAIVDRPSELATDFPVEPSPNDP